jgi:ribonuclease HI
MPSFPTAARNIQGASRNFINVNLHPIVNHPPPAVDSELELAMLAGDGDDAEQIRNADAVHSEAQSQDLVNEALIESRSGPSNAAAMLLFSCGPIKRSRDGYILNDFVRPDTTPSPPLLSPTQSDGSDPSYYPSQENVCPECLQPLPSQSPCAKRSLPPERVLPPIVVPLVTVASSTGALPLSRTTMPPATLKSSLNVLSPNLLLPASPAPATSQRTGTLQTASARAMPPPSFTCTNNATIRAFFSSPPKPLPTLPAYSHNGAAARLPSPQAFTELQPCDLTAIVASELLVNVPSLMLPSIVPQQDLSASPDTLNDPTASTTTPPLPPLIGIHKNPGPLRGHVDATTTTRLSNLVIDTASSLDNRFDAAFASFSIHPSRIDTRTASIFEHAHGSRNASRPAIRGFGNQPLERVPTLPLPSATLEYNEFPVGVFFDKDNHSSRTHSLTLVVPRAPPTSPALNAGNHASSFFVPTPLTSLWRYTQSVLSEVRYLPSIQRNYFPPFIGSESVLIDDFLSRVRQGFVLFQGDPLPPALYVLAHRAASSRLENSTTPPRARSPVRPRRTAAAASELQVVTQSTLTRNAIRQIVMTASSRRTPPIALSATRDRTRFSAHPEPLTLTAVELQAAFAAAFPRTDAGVESSPPAAPLVGIHPNPGPSSPIVVPADLCDAAVHEPLRYAAPSGASVAFRSTIPTITEPFMRRVSSRLPVPNPRYQPDAGVVLPSMIPPQELFNTRNPRGAGCGHPHSAVIRRELHIEPLRNLMSSQEVEKALDDFQIDIMAEYLGVPRTASSTAALAPLDVDSVAALRQNTGSLPDRRNQRMHSFPLGLHPPPLNTAPPQDSFKLDCALFPDGGSKDRVGSWAGLYRDADNTIIICTGHIPNQSTNNLAELTAAHEVLLVAKSKEKKRPLLTTDSELVANFLKGTGKIEHRGLKEIAAKLLLLIATFEALYVSHVSAHANVCAENAVVDALCTWNLQAKHSIRALTFSPALSNLSALMTRVNTEYLGRPLDPNLNSNKLCSLCLKTNEHNVSCCPITKFSLSFVTRQTFTPCLGCLSREHSQALCPFLCIPRRLPCLSALSPEPEVDLELLGPLPNLAAINFSTLHFPRHQNLVQFSDYWTTTFVSLLQATTALQANAAGEAAEQWSLHYTIDGFSILSRQTRHVDPLREGSNLHAHLDDPDLDLARRALRAARLGPDARVSDVSKALRKGQTIPINDDIIQQLSRLYPQAATDAIPIIFEPKPIPKFAVNRHAVAHAIMSRSPNSHPGKRGITFGILQLFCKITYKKESPNSPDIRWTILCNLLAHIMSGNALALSDMFHTVVGIFFDKNADSPGLPVSLRNIGVEESLVRVAAALVFSSVVEDTIESGHLSCWELGCGVKSGAEIFGRLAAVAAEAGMIVAVFDVEKAFNNLKRSDIKAAVDDLNNPLLSAFVHYLFRSDPIVTFQDKMRSASFTLTTGILQGNPLSTFLFSLTVRYILKGFRLQHPNTLTPNFVDDLLFIGKPTADYAVGLRRFIALFRSHNLNFDFADKAKTSVFSKLPLAVALHDAISALGIRIQNEGIAPCKIPFGTSTYVETLVSKLTNKFRRRADAFRALWPAMLKLKLTLKRTRIGVYEGYLNILRLSLLSMTNYTLRTVPPLFSAPYAGLTSTLALDLIEHVFPPMLNLIGKPVPAPVPFFPDLLALSRSIMQLPMTLGGLSLRLPRSIHRIAYVASCGECIPHLLFMATRLDFAFTDALIPELIATRQAVTLQVQGFEVLKPDESISFVRNGNPTSLQESITALFNCSEIVRIEAELKPHTVLALAFKARTDLSQRHCSWAFNPVARLNLNLAALADEDFSRAIQIAILRPVTLPRLCDCGAIIDPVGLHFLHCNLVHFGYLHDCVKHAIASTIRSFQPRDLAPISVLTERKVNLFYPLRYPEYREGIEIVADVVALFDDNSQNSCLIADVSSVLARGFNASIDFQAPARARSRAKRLKYDKYDIPPHLFHPITVGRTNVLSMDALKFCDFMGKFFPSVLKAADKIKASMSRAIVVGAARTLNTAFRRMQLATFNGVNVAQVPKAAACRLFDRAALPVFSSGSGDALLSHLPASLRTAVPASAQGASLLPFVHPVHPLGGVVGTRASLARANCLPSRGGGAADVESGSPGAVQVMATLQLDPSFVLDRTTVARLAVPFSLVPGGSASVAVSQASSAVLSSSVPPPLGSAVQLGSFEDPVCVDVRTVVARLAVPCSSVPSGSASVAVSQACSAVLSSSAPPPAGFAGQLASVEGPFLVSASVLDAVIVAQFPLVLPLLDVAVRPVCVIRVPSSAPASRCSDSAAPFLASDLSLLPVDSAAVGVTVDACDP